MNILQKLLKKYFYEGMETSSAGIDSHSYYCRLPKLFSSGLKVAVWHRLTHILSQSHVKLI